MEWTLSKWLTNNKVSMAGGSEWQRGGRQGTGAGRSQTRQVRDEGFRLCFRCSGKPLRESKQKSEMRMNHHAGPE